MSYWTAEDDQRLEISKLPAEAVAECSPERAVIEVLAQICSQLEARVENGQLIKFAKIYSDPVMSFEGLRLPALQISRVSLLERNAADPIALVDKEGNDITDKTKSWVLYGTEEDIGTLSLTIWAQMLYECRALYNAVKQVFLGDIEHKNLLFLPVPLAILPPVIRDQWRRLPSADSSRIGPYCSVWLEDSVESINDEGGQTSIYRAGLRISWQCQRFHCKPYKPVFQDFDVRIETCS